MANDTDDGVPLDDWKPMLESDDLFLSSNIQPQAPAKQEATKPRIVVQDSEDDESIIIYNENPVGSNIPSGEPPVSQAPTKKRKRVSFTGVINVESDDSSELTSLNPDDVDSDFSEVLPSKRKPASQSQQPTPIARRPIFIKKEVQSPNPSVPSVDSVPSIPKTKSKTKKRLQPIKEEEDDASSENVSEDEFSEDDDEEDDDYEDDEIGGAKRYRNSSGRFVRNTRPAVCSQCHGLT